MGLPDGTQIRCRCRPPTGLCYLFPILVVVLAGLTTGEFLTFPPKGLSLRWVISFLNSEKYLSAFFFSFKLALMTMIVSTILGTAAALFIARSSFVGRTALRAFFLSPVVLPGVVVGFALYAFFITSGLGISRTIWGLWIGHILYSTPYVIGTVGASLATFDVSLEEAARSLGASPRAFHRITFLSPGIGGVTPSSSLWSVRGLAAYPRPIRTAAHRNVQFTAKFEPDAAAAVSASPSLSPRFF